MRAVVTATGGREVLEQIERPEPVAGPGEALVEIAVAGSTSWISACVRGCLD
jgi:NADPH2:quinone reductase